MRFPGWYVTGDSGRAVSGGMVVPTGGNIGGNIGGLVGIEVGVAVTGGLVGPGEGTLVEGAISARGALVGRRVGRLVEGTTVGSGMGNAVVIICGGSLFMTLNGGNVIFVVSDCVGAGVG